MLHIIDWNRLIILGQWFLLEHIPNDLWKKTTFNMQKLDDNLPKESQHILDQIENYVLFKIHLQISTLVIL